MNVLRSINARLPFEVAVAGRKRNVLFSVFDPIFFKTTRNDVISTALGPIYIESTHGPERWLSYAFFNVLNYYKSSALGNYMARNVRARSVFVDVGANLGMYAYVAKSLGYSTYVVEPEPMHAAFLRRNAEIFGKLLAVALSDSIGVLPLFYEERNSGATSLVPAKGYKQGSESVAVCTFSSLSAEGAFSDLDKVTLIKVDVEGAEVQMVSGMAEFLKCGYRPAIWCEVRGDRSGRARPVAIAP